METERERAPDKRKPKVEKYHSEIAIIIRAIMKMCNNVHATKARRLERAQDKKPHAELTS